MEADWPAKNSPAPGQGRSGLGRIEPWLRRVPGFALLKLLRYQVRMRYGSPVRRLSPQAHAPWLMMLESSALCNLSCAKCGHRSSARPLGTMETGLALDLVDQAAKTGIQVVCLSMLGEPLLHPELERIIARVSQRGLFPYLTTNALLLSPEKSRSLIEARIKQIVVSIDGWDSASYAHRQGGADLGQVLDNLRRFREIRGDRRLPWLASITVLDSESQSRLAEIKRLLKSYVEELRIIPLTDFGIPGHEVDPKLLLGTRSWKRVPCGYLWRVLNVGWDGRVTACCNDHNYLLAYHRVQDAPLQEIWQCPQLQEWRGRHLRGEFDQMPMCGPCTFDWANSFSFGWTRHRFSILKVKS